MNFAYEDVPVPKFHFTNKDNEGSCVSVLIARLSEVPADSRCTVYGDFMDTYSDIDPMQIRLHTSLEQKKRPNRLAMPKLCM